MLHVGTRGHRGVRGLATRAGLTAVAFATLLFLSAVFVATSEGTVMLSVNDLVISSRIVYSEPCTPGTFVSGAGLPNPSIIDVGQNPTRSNPLLITVSGSIANCLDIDTVAPTPPSGGRLLVADSNPELFYYTTVTARTTAYVTNNPGDSDPSHHYEGVVSMEVFPVNQLPADWPTRFVGTGQAFIEGELVNYSVSGSTFTILPGGRGQSGTSIDNHPIGSLVRLQGRLKLIGRNGRIYVGYNAGGEPTTGAFSHSAGATLRGPNIQLSCRGALAQATTVGNDHVTSRSRCYAVVEPGVAWGDEPVANDAVLPLVPVFYHETSNGTINVIKNMDNTQDLTLSTDYLGITCFPYIQDAIWSKITSTIHVNTNFDPGTFDDGAFRITLYSDSNCTTPLPGAAIGTNDSLAGKGSGVNERVAQLTPGLNGADTDLDGCSDKRELSTSPADGGARDPMNMWDYFNPANNSGNGSADITAVVTHYGYLPPSANYGARWDRGGAIAGGPAWTFRPPNGNINTGDITAAVNSYGHNCPAPTFTGIGKMPDKITSSNTGPYTLQAIPMGSQTGLDWPSPFPASGTAHLGAEVVCYTKSGSTFTITSRGKAGTTATAHLAGAFVWIPAPADTCP